ncbi:YibE/F family protein [Candidatus Nomurabacteria bacterium]|nr:MAG: YibE/F family protein [Candidatus Nomurabacteria bacterium]
MFKFFKISLVLICFILPGFSNANTEDSLIEDTVTSSKAKVIQVVNKEVDLEDGVFVNPVHQEITALIISGEEKGKEVSFINDYIELKEGEIFYLKHVTNEYFKTDHYSVEDPYRIPILYILIGLFIISVLVFGGIQGLRGLVSLFGSLFLILYVLMPAILNGYSPIMVSIGVSSLIIIIGSYVTHGFNKTTTSAVIGMIVTVLITGVLAYLSVHLTSLTGFSDEESIYLNFNTGGSIDFIGLLFGGIMIGLLGVLYDVAIGQAISVEELHRIGPHVSRVNIYKRAIRMGREHIGALVNTLAIAYVGASLPLLLLFYSVSGLGSHAPIINQEIFAVEIVRTMIGSIGLVLAVPITTLLSVFILMKKQKEGNSEIEEKEMEEIKNHKHHH